MQKLLRPNFLAFIVVILHLFIGSAQTYAQSFRGSLASLESILKEANTLDAFLASPTLRDRYYKELELYMGEESNFRGSYDDLLNQLSEVVAKYPEVAERVWTEQPVQIFNLKSSAQNALNPNLRVRSLPRLFHALFKGIHAHEPTGGYNPFMEGFHREGRANMSSLTPLRWASPLIEGAQFYHVEVIQQAGQVTNFDSYKGFIQVIPGEFNGEKYGALEIESLPLIQTHTKVEQVDSLMNRCLRELFRRMPSNWKGLVFSNARVDEYTYGNELRPQDEFRLTNAHYIFGTKLEAQEHIFKIDDPIVAKLAGMKYAANTIKGGAYIWGNQLIIQATVTQVAIENTFKKNNYIKSLEVLNPNPPAISETLTFQDVLNYIEEASGNGREEGLLKTLLSRLKPLDSHERASLLKEFKEKRISSQTLLTFYNSAAIKELNNEEVKIILAEEKNRYLERYRNFELPNVEELLDSKSLEPMSELSFRLTNIYSSVYNFKKPIEDWLDKVKSIPNYKALLVFQALAQSSEVALPAARALQLINPIKTPPNADILVANMLEHGVANKSENKFIEVNTSYMNRLIVDYIQSAKVNSHKKLIDNIILYALSDMSLSKDLSASAVHFLSQKGLILDPDQLKLLDQVKENILKGHHYKAATEERISEIEKIKLNQNHPFSQKDCKTLIMEIISH